jgi:hypothetical protein
MAGGPYWPAPTGAPTRPRPAAMRPDPNPSPGPRPRSKADAPPSAAPSRSPVTTTRGGGGRRLVPHAASGGGGGRGGGEMSGWLKALAYGAGGVAVAGLAALVALQERLVYVPVLPGLARAYPITPARLRLSYEDVWLRAADGVRLHSWFIRHSPSCRGEREAASGVPSSLPSLPLSACLFLSCPPWAVAVALQVR